MSAHTCMPMYTAEIWKKIFKSFLIPESIFSLAWVSSKTHSLQHVFGRILYSNRGSLCQTFLAETVKTGTKNHWAIEATHVY